MRLAEFSFLADENFDPGAVAYIRSLGWQVTTTHEAGLIGKPDVEIVRFAHSAGSVVLTHDSDFGMFAVATKEPITGIVYVRPGHIRAEFTIKTLEVVVARDPELHPPFILVARHTDNEVVIRVRKL